MHKLLPAFIKIWSEKLELKFVVFILLTNKNIACIINFYFQEHTLQILNDFGYALDPQGDYVYQKTDSAREKTRRENAANEFQQFFDELKKIKDGSCIGIKEFLTVNVY